MPLIVRWPGVVKPGAVCRVPVVSTDFYPTLLAAASLEAATDAADGENLMPLLRQTGSLRRKAIYFHYPNYAWHGANRLGSAIRQGDYKLIEYLDDGSVELYNLAEDIGEKRNLAARIPDKAAQLKRNLHAWRKATGASMPKSR